MVHIMIVLSSFLICMMPLLTVWLMGTNPAPVNAITYHVKQNDSAQVGNIQPVDQERNSRYIVLTGLEIKFTELSNHDMKVDISWDEYDISNDTRWTGNIVLGEKLNIEQGVNLDLDLNLSPNQHLEDSVTGVFSEKTKMYCQQGSQIKQELNSTVTVKNKSELILQSGSEYVIKDGAELRIKPESKLKIGSCVDFIVEGTGKLIVENNATICIDPGAQVSLHDPGSIELQDGYENGEGCLEITPENIHEELNIPPTHLIQDTTVWSSMNDKNVLQDIVVADGGELTLLGSTLQFDENSRLIVKPGGRLNVYRSQLTHYTACGANNLWPGIEVRGDPYLSQIPPSNQGYMKIDSASIISNAETGILVSGPRWADPRDEEEPVYPAPTGGIVKAKNTTFLNNKVSVRFGSYENQNSSHFDACHFETTDTLLENKIPDYFMKFYGVKDITMDSCLFENNSGYDYFGNGIYSSDSHFELDGNCTDNYVPCDHFDFSKMKNLHYAIKATEHTPDEYIDVRHTRFIDNYKGVLMSSINDARFTSNEIQVPYEVDTTYGLYMENCNGYHVENNDFHSKSSGTGLGNMIGMYILNSGPYYNIVYNNEFTSLGYGIMAVGENRNGTDDGLCFKCNDFEGVNTDILVTPEYDGQSGDNIGIAYHQGSLDTLVTAPAGNTFTENQSVLEYNLDNSYGAEDFWYYYHGINETQEKVKPNPVNDSTTINVGANDYAEYTKDSACPSHLHNGGEPIDEIRSTMETSSQEASQTETTLQTLEDDGNTQQLNFEVLSSLPYEAQQLYLDLMSKSPYLSDTVLKSSAVKEEVLTDMLIRDIMVSNPQSAKEDEVIEKLENRDNPLPDYMMAQIMAGLDSIGAKEILERELAGHRTRRQSAYRDLHRIFKTDTALTGGSDSLMNLLQEEPDVSAKYELAFMHLDREEYGQAQGVVNSIPGQFELTEEQAAEQADFTQLIDVLVEADQDSLWFPSLDSAHIAELNEIENNDNGMAAV
ncbi:MAG: hypothetical protein K9I68_05005, partial [Bacteroidales bacterium]|nr:hypothetical protein [Bacteroidales bacterium]MCF8337796.1 hypothetical protein [Bacteroidales bacterium]